jgi:GDPmannose 4,6-dehydratase
MHLEGKATAEVGRRGDTGAVVVCIDPCCLRPAEVDTLLGDPSQAREKLGWMPTTTLEELVAVKVAAYVEDAKKEAYLNGKDFPIVGSMEDPPTNSGDRSTFVWVNYV